MLRIHPYVQLSDGATNGVLSGVPAQQLEALVGIDHQTIQQTGDHDPVRTGVKDTQEFFVVGFTLGHIESNQADAKWLAVSIQQRKLGGFHQAQATRGGHGDLVLQQLASGQHLLVGCPHRLRRFLSHEVLIELASQRVGRDAVGACELRIAHQVPAIFALDRDDHRGILQERLDDAVLFRLRLESGGHRLHGAHHTHQAQPVAARSAQERQHPQHLPRHAQPCADTCEGQGYCGDKHPMGKDGHRLRGGMGQKCILQQLCPHRLRVFTERWRGR